MKKLLFLGVVLALLLGTTTTLAAKPTTLVVWWYEDAQRYGGDGSDLGGWANDPITIEFRNTGQAYHAGMDQFYNQPLDNFSASPLVISRGSFAAWARYTSNRSGLPILDKLRGELSIDPEVQTAYGSYVQHSYVEGITDEQTVLSWYPYAVRIGQSGRWLVGVTYYIVHGQIEN